MHKRVEHIIDISADRFYDTVYFNEDFNKDLYDHLGFRERKLLKQEERGDGMYREVLQVPERDLPGAVKKVIGADQLAYTEKSNFDKKSGRVAIEVVSSVKPDKISVKGAFWVEPNGADKCRRIFEVDVKVSIFAVGGMIEKMILDDVVKSYDKAAIYTNEWLRDNA